MSPSFGKSVIFPLGALFGGIFFSLFLVEISLRAFGFQFRLYPEEVQFGFPDPVRMKDLYTRDSDLFWVQKDYYQKLKNYEKQGVDIVHMGDSCTEFGEYDIFLQKLIDESPSLKGLTVGKVGVGGWSSYQGVKQLKRDVLPLHPKLVTVYFGWNDHWIGFGIEDKEVAKLNSSLFSAFHNLRFVQLVTKAFVVGAQDEKDVYPKRVSLDDFRKNLEEIVTVSKSNNILPMLLTAPSSHRKGKEPKYLKDRFIKKLGTLVPLHQSYVKVVREVGINKNVPVCDLAASFEGMPIDDVVNVYFTKDGIHLSEAGNKKLAEFLFACLGTLTLK